MKKILFMVLFFGMIGACQNRQNATLYQPFLFKKIKTPCKEGGESNLFVSENGQVYLTWIEYLNDSTDALLFSKLENQKWSMPQEIARGSNWFVNWADFPSFVAYPDEGHSLAVHWLQKSAGGSYDYDIRIAQSTDEGQSWENPFIPHRDSIAAEHGFMTMFPISKDRIFATWLDGRNTKISEQSSVGSKQGEHTHGHGGAMTLRTAEFDRRGNLYEEEELDNRICDCCQTDAALTSQGPVVVYRDRSENEIRDISIVRKVNGKWTIPQRIHSDNWKIAGCPVNGPAIAAIEDEVAVAWFTSGEAIGKINVAFSKDAGISFSSPIRIDDGNPSGRVGIVLLSKSIALVSWLENTGAKAEIRVAKVNIEGKIGESVMLVETNPSRSSGFPILAKSGDKLYLSWTEGDSLTRVQTALLRI